MEELCGSVSPTDGVDLCNFFAERTRTISTISSGCGDDEPTEEGCANTVA